MTSSVPPEYLSILTCTCIITALTKVWSLDSYYGGVACVTQQLIFHWEGVGGTESCMMHLRVLGWVKFGSGRVLMRAMVTKAAHCPLIVSDDDVRFLCNAEDLPGYE